MLIRLFRLILSIFGPLAVGYIVWMAITSQLNSAANAPKQNINVQISPVLIEEIKRVNKQIFVEQYSSVDITYNEAPASWGNLLEQIGIRQQFIVILRGRVPAGFDLSELSEDDIWVSADGTRAQITLPAPKIFTENVSIDSERTRVFAESDACPDFLCSTDLQAYTQQIEPEGRARLIQAAEESGILRQAAIEGKLYYERLLNQLGVTEVRVIVEGYDL
ncbi:MAG: DUF4230 domain-containing protein [Roseiflexaceae bacterium]